MSKKRNMSSSSCDVSVFAMNHNFFSKEDLNCDMEIPENQAEKPNTLCTVQSVIGFPSMDEKWRNSELSVHSMMVTDEEKYNYMGSSNSVYKEETRCKRENSLIRYKNNHGLSSLNCIDTGAVESDIKSNLKDDLKEFSNIQINDPKYSKMVKNKSGKKQNNSSKNTLSGRSVSRSGDIKNSNKKRRNTQHGLILDVALLHDVDYNKKSGKTWKSFQNSIDDGGLKNSSPKGTGSDNKKRLSPTLLITPSPCPSYKSEDGEGSETSSLYHSSYFTPSDGNKIADGVLTEMQPNFFGKKLNKLALESPPLRTQSAMGSNDKKDLPSTPERLRIQRRASALAENVFRNSLPYIPSGSTLPEAEIKTINIADLQPFQMRDPDMFCVPKWGNVCGGAMEQKDINDQTCRSNFGMVLSALCFILFLWYLGMVYSRFINKALRFDAIESLLTSTESEIIQEVVIDISASDFKLLPHQ